MATKTKSLADLESDNEQAPPAIPPGTQADVTVKFKTGVNPNLDNESSRARRFNDELYELAAEEIEDTARPMELPLDPVTEFCNTWRNYAGCLMKVTRLPDPATRRAYTGQPYNRTNLEIESLGSVPFDPLNLESTLQIINGNSGGVFRIWLLDQYGQPVQDAFLDRVAIGDPPKQFTRERERESRYYVDETLGYASRNPAPAPAPPQKSETEIELERIKSDLFNKVLQRALDPPAPPPATNPISSLSPQDQVGLYILNNGGLIPALMEKMTAIAGAPDTAAAKPSWQERGVDALLQIAQTNPAIVERVSGVVERIFERVLPDPRAPVNIAPNLQPQVTRHPPAQRANAPLSAKPADITSNTVNNPDGPDIDEQIDVDEDEEIMDIIESLFTLLSDTRPFTVNEPVFIELGQAYPQKFAGALRMIAVMPIDQIVEWIKTQGTLYEALLNGSVTGPHYRARLIALQVFCQSLNQPAPPQTQPMVNNANTSIETTEDEDADNNPGIGG